MAICRGAQNYPFKVLDQAVLLIGVVKTEIFGGVSDFSCKYTHGTSTVGGRGKATVRTTVRTDK